MNKIDNIGDTPEMHNKAKKCIAKKVAEKAKILSLKLHLKDVIFCSLLHS